MSDQAGFIAEGFAAMREVFDELVGRYNLHLHPDEITRSLARRVRRTVKLLETMLRRLLALMAAEMSLEPARPSGPRDRTRPVTKRPRGFVLLLPPGGCLSSLQAEKLAGRKPARNRPSTGLLLARLFRLQRLLENPAPAARRMARLLARLKASGAPRPPAFPQSGLYRYGARLALVADALPHAVREALAGWYDTG